MSGRVKVPVGLLDFKANSGAIDYSRIFPCWDAFPLEFSVF